jgi:hypothetical protein
MQVPQRMQHREVALDRPIQLACIVTPFSVIHHCDISIFIRNISMLSPGCVCLQVPQRMQHREVALDRPIQLACIGAMEGLIAGDDVENLQVRPSVIHRYRSGPQWADRYTFGPRTGAHVKKSVPYLPRTAIER